MRDVNPKKKPQYTNKRRTGYTTKLMDYVLSRIEECALYELPILILTKTQKNAENLAKRLQEKNKELVLKTRYGPAYYKNSVVFVFGNNSHTTHYKNVGINFLDVIEDNDQ